jgi:hypothetical protein
MTFGRDWNSRAILTTVKIETESTGPNHVRWQPTFLGHIRCRSLPNKFNALLMSVFPLRRLEHRHNRPSHQDELPTRALRDQDD